MQSKINKVSFYVDDINCKVEKKRRGFKEKNLVGAEEAQRDIYLPKMGSLNVEKTFKNKI